MGRYSVDRGGEVSDRPQAPRTREIEEGREDLTRAQRSYRRTPPSPSAILVATDGILGPVSHFHTGQPHRKVHFRPFKGPREGPARSQEGPAARNLIRAQRPRRGEDSTRAQRSRRRRTTYKDLAGQLSHEQSLRQRNWLRIPRESSPQTFLMTSTACSCSRGSVLIQEPTAGKGGRRADASSQRSTLRRA